MKLSIVIPVYNALESFKNTLLSLADNTDNFYELVIVDDASHFRTRNFIKGLDVSSSFPVRLTKTTNPEHLWTNASWNIGVRLATGDFIAVLNSDITVSPHWDTELISLLNKKHCTIACPTEIRNGKAFTLDPLIERVDPHMIKGAAFMFRRQDTRNLFPIPDFLTHFCGDNYLADQANKKKGVAFSAQATITHQITQSGKTVDPLLYSQTVLTDVLNYQSHSGRDMSLVLDQLKPSLPHVHTESQGD